MGRDGAGDEDDGGERREGSGGLERMLIDDGAEMERRNGLSGHMTRDSAPAVSAMRPALHERERECVCVWKWPTSTWNENLGATEKFKIS